MDLLTLLHGVALFDGLSDEQLQRLIAISQEEIFDNGAVIVQQGAPGDKLYVVTEGQVEVRLRRRPELPERAQVYLGCGQVIGEMALLDEAPRSATVRACRDRTVLRAIAHDSFSALCREDTAIGYIVMRNMARDLSFKLRHRNLDLGAGSQ